MNEFCFHFLLYLRTILIKYNKPKFFEQCKYNSLFHWLTWTDKYFTARCLIINLRVYWRSLEIFEYFGNILFNNHGILAVLQKNSTSFSIIKDQLHNSALTFEFKFGKEKWINFELHPPVLNCYRMRKSSFENKLKFTVFSDSAGINWFSLQINFKTANCNCVSYLIYDNDTPPTLR